MKLKYILLTVALALPFAASAADHRNAIDELCTEDVNFAEQQYSLMLDKVGRSGRIVNPKTIDKMSRLVTIPIDDWCSGFFAGSMWYLYRLTDDKQWERQARRYTELLDSIQYLTWHHDVGFMIGSSYLNGYRVNPSKAYKKVIVQTAKSLCTRYRPGAKIIQSWNTDRGWQSQRGWSCPVIIDNMMNLELLFEATRLSPPTGTSPSTTPTRRSPISSAPMAAASTWSTTTPPRVRCSTARRRRAMPTTAHGRVVRRGPSMASPSVTATPTTSVTSTRPCAR